MDNSMMIHELRKLSAEHQNDVVPTFSTNWSNLCRDCANKIEELSIMIDKLSAENKDLHNEIINLCKLNEPENLVPPSIWSKLSGPETDGLKKLIEIAKQK